MHGPWLVRAGDTVVTETTPALPLAGLRVWGHTGLFPDNEDTECAGLG